MFQRPNEDKIRAYEYLKKRAGSVFNVYGIPFGIDADVKEYQKWLQ